MPLHSKQKGKTIDQFTENSPRLQSVKRRKGLFPLHSTEDGLLFDVGFVAKGQFQHLREHLFCKVVGLETEFEKSRMHRIVVVVLRLDARVRHVIDLHFEPHVLSRLLQLARHLVHTAWPFAPITDFGSGLKSVKRSKGLFPQHLPEDGTLMSVRQQKTIWINRSGEDLPKTAQGQNR